jgi:hypothetical protein
MNWAERRKLTYILSILLVLGSISFVVIRNLTKVESTCMDGKKNGDESGVDCGGSCNFYCANELADPKVLWSRTFPVTDGIVHAVAYIEHSYPGAAARKIRYSFKLYDDQNNLIVEKIGSTFLGAMGRTAIVETLIKTANMKPTIARFTILPPIPWEKVPTAFSQVVIDTSHNLLEDFSGGSRLTANIENTSRFNFKDLEVTAILYDKDGNAITASKSAVDSLNAKQKKTIYFTWAYKISSRVDRIEVIPRFNPFTAESI